MAARRPRAHAEARAIKLKLTGELELDLARVAAVRAARPDVWLGVDANQGFARAELDWLIEALVAQDVALLEQPLRARRARPSSRASARRSRSPPTKAR